MSRFTNLSTVRIKYFGSWKSNFIEDNKSLYCDIFFKNFQIHQYLKGIFYRLKVLSDDFYIKRFFYGNLFIYMNLYLYRFSIYSYVLGFFNLQYLLYDFFFFRNCFIKFNFRLSLITQSISYFLYNAMMLCGNVRSDSIFFYFTNFFMNVNFKYRFGNHFINTTDFFDYKSVHFLDFLSRFYVGGSNCSFADKLISQNNYFFRRGNKDMFRKQTIKNFSFDRVCLESVRNKNFKGNIFFYVVDNFIFYLIFYKSMIYTFTYMFYIFGLKESRVFFYFFSKLFDNILRKFHLLKFFINSYFFIGVVQESSVVRNLTFNYKNEIAYRDEFDEYNYYDFFFYFFFMYLILSVESTIFFFTGNFCVFYPNFYYFKKFPPILSSRLVGEFFLFELEKGESIYRVLKNIQKFQLKEKFQLRKDFYGILKKRMFNFLVNHKYLNRKYLKKSNFFSFYLLNLKSSFYDFLLQLNEVISNEITNKKFPLLGIRIECSGSTKKGKQARMVAYHHIIKNHKFFGKMPYQSVMADVDYYQTFARTKSGSIGIKVWIFFYTKYYDTSYRLVSIV